MSHKNSFNYKIRNNIDKDINIDFLPDKYYIRKNHKQIYLIEYVKSNDLSEIKLEKLGFFWCDCDSYDWEVKLIVKHWYGTKSLLNLRDIYYKFSLPKLITT
jgi:hypothetical protein